MVDWSGAQASVIGSALIDGKCVPEILAEMRQEDFTGEYRRYFDAFCRLAAENTAVDPVTVLNIIGPRYRELTAEMMRQTVTAANVGAYIQVCKEQSRLRLLRDCGAELSGAATLEEARETLSRAASVSLDTNRQTSWSAGECMVEYFDALDRGEKPDFLQTDMKALDDTLKVTEGNQIVVAGYTGHGKTALALQLAYAISRKKKVGYFLLEMTRQEISERLLSLVSQIDYEKILARTLTAEEIKYCARAASKIDSAHLRFEKPKRCTIEAIRAKTLREGYEVVFVDYLQILEATDRRLDAFQKVTENSLGLKRMAEDYKITTYVLSQMKRSQPSNGEFIPFPKLSDLRQSGQIEQDANAVVFVHAPLPDSRRAFRVLNIPKNRKGPPTSFYYTFKGEVQTFRPPTNKEYDEYVAVMKKLEQKKEKQKPSQWLEPEIPTPDNPFAQQALPM